MILILEVLCLIWALQTIAFGIAVQTGRNSVADVFWGLNPAVITVYVSLPLFLATWAVDPRLIFFSPALLIAGCTIIWGTRLTVHIGRRFLHKTKEDPRYAAMSQGWTHYFLRSYLQVFMLQGALMAFMLSALLTTVLASQIPNLYCLAAGVLIWIFGFTFEVVGDAQLARFVKTKKPGEIMTQGLWRYTRHPNYFGEVTLWWGIWLLTLPTPYWYLTLITPLTITFLILKVSGIPMAEARYQDNLEFQKYAAKTNAFFPWWPKN